MKNLQFNKLILSLVFEKIILNLEKFITNIYRLYKEKNNHSAKKNVSKFHFI